MRARFAMTFLAVALHATATFADVSVTASVDQRRVAFGETIVYTINVNGARGNGPWTA